MTDPITITSLVVAVLTLFVMCALWQELSAMRYKDKQDKNEKHRKWYHLFGKLNEIDFWIKVVAIVLFGLVVFVCLHYLCTTYPHQSKEIHNMDYLGVISAFFGLLVTILVGWNIYNTIDAKGEMGKFRDEKDDIYIKAAKIAKETVNTRLLDYDHQIQSELSLIRGLTWAQKNTPVLAMKYFISALEHQNLCNEPTHKEEIIEFIDGIISSSDVSSWLTQSRLNKTIELVGQSKADGSINLLRKLTDIDITTLQPF